MALDVTALASAMASAAQSSFKKKWPQVKEYAQAEARKTAETLAMIERLTLAGDISPEEARIHLRMQKNSSMAVMLAIQGLGILAVEDAINAALGAVRKTVNTALGFALL
jgi:hypothetical protein